MFRSKLVLASLIAVFLACFQVEAVGPTTVYWDVCGEGGWGDPCNWDPPGIPDNDGNTFAVIIDSLGCPNGVEVGLTENYTINQLDCYGDVEIISWDGWHQLTLVEADGLRNFGHLEVEEIDIGGNVTNFTGATLELCDIDIERDLLNLAMINVEYEARVEGDLQNVGTIEIAPAGQLGVEGEFWNYDSGTILIYGGECGADKQMLYNNGVIGGFGVLYGGQDVQNQDQGQIIASGGSLVIACEGALTNTGLLRNEPLASLQIKHMESQTYAVNYGDIVVNAGGGVAFDGNVETTLDNEGTIELLNGTLAAAGIIQRAGADFAGFGTIVVSNMLYIESDAEIEFTGPTNIMGSLHIANGATLIISAGQTLITGHTGNNGTIVLAGGTVIFAGGYSGYGNIINAAHPGGIIIDNDDDGTSSTGTWNVSGTPGFYGDNSRYCWKQSGASYSFEAWVVGAREVSLWWNAWPNRSTNVSVGIYDGGDLLDTVTVNQKNNGGKWNALGYYSFTDKAEVRIVSPGSGATVADAVRFGPSNEIVIDNGDEGTSSTGTWQVSGTPGFYGDNSRYCWKQAGDSYSFEAPILGTYKISLWWTAHANRSTNVSIEIYDGGTLLDTVTDVNQQINGGKWNVLGTYSFSYGAKVKIVSPGSGATVADAVKFAPL